jgi:hypothetical protein
MHHCLRLDVTVILAASLGLPWLLLAADAPMKSALETDSSGWTNLLQEGLTRWKRVPIPPDSKLKDVNPWSTKDGMLYCAGKGAGHEMLLYDAELADGIFHVEWRFPPVENGKGYNSGVYVRNSADGAIWHQAQVGNKNVGFLFGTTRVDGAPRRFNIKAVGPQRGKEAGAWNVYEIECRGKTVKLWINGAITCTWDDCQVPRGFLGLEAEGWAIEFRNVKWKNLK